MSKATVYQYFSGKHEIFAEVISSYVNEVVEATRLAVTSARTHEGKIRAHILTGFAKARELASLQKISEEVFQELIPFADAAAKGFREEQIDALSGLLRDGAAAGVFDIENPGLLSRGIHMALRGLHLQYPVVQSHDQQRAEDALIDVILRGLVYPRLETPRENS